MSPKDRLRIFMVFVLYVGLGALIGAQCLFGIIDNQNGTSSELTDIAVAIHNPSYQHLAFGSGLFVLFALMTKIISSVSRSKMGAIGPSPINILSLDFTFFGHFKTLCIFLFPWVVSFIKSKIIS